MESKKATTVLSDIMQKLSSIGKPEEVKEEVVELSEEITEEEVKEEEVVLAEEDEVAEEIVEEEEEVEKKSKKKSLTKRSMFQEKSLKMLSLTSKQCSSKFLTATKKRN